MQNHIMTIFSYYMYSLILFALNNKKNFDLYVHIHQHNTRNKGNMHLTNINRTKVKKGPYFSCISMFNHLPNNIKSLDFNIKKHKEILKNFFLEHRFYSIDEYYIVQGMNHEYLAYYSDFFYSFILYFLLLFTILLRALTYLLFTC